MRLFVNELCKIKASKSVKWITAAFFCFACSLLAYVAVYILIACLFREAVPTFIASLVVTLCELFNLFRGPVRIAMDAIDFIESDRILTSDFAALFTPCLYILVISLTGAYILFLIQDVD